MKRILFIAGSIVLLTACNNGLKDQESSTPVLVSDSTKEADCVFLASDEKDQPVITWCETDDKTGNKGFYMARFDKSSNGFSSRIAVPIEQNAKFHEEGMPKIAVKSNGTIIAVYEISAPTEKNRFAGFVHYIVSTDKGKTWTNPVPLANDTTQGTSHSFAAITRLSDGEIDGKLSRNKGDRSWKCHCSMDQ